MINAIIEITRLIVAVSMVKFYLMPKVRDRFDVLC
jgi:hypothetical protein